MHRLFLCSTAAKSIILDAKVSAAYHLASRRQSHQEWLQISLQAFGLVLESLAASLRHTNSARVEASLPTFPLGSQVPWARCRRYRGRPPCQACRD